uniref:Peptidase_M13_N domain-containing protein n=1 Tax=Rhabditophanes sp. KR3021 TaxID=114890 RepID=A0AC35UE75_9BILA
MPRNLSPSNVDRDNDLTIVTFESEPYSRSAHVSPTQHSFPHHSPTQHSFAHVSPNQPSFAHISPTKYSFTRSRSVIIEESDIVSHPSRSGPVSPKKIERSNTTSILKTTDIHVRRAINDNTLPKPSTPEPDPNIDEEQNEEEEVEKITLTERFKNVLNKINCLYLIIAIIIILLILLAIGLAIGLGITKNNQEPFCTSETCLETSSRFGDYIDTKQPVCDNIYKFACGNVRQLSWEDQTSRYARSWLYKPEYFLEAGNKMQNQLVLLLNRTSEPDLINTDLALRVTKTIFDACMNVELRMQQGLRPLTSVMEALPCSPVSPLCKTFNSSTFELERSIGRFGFYAGEYNIINYDKDADPDRKYTVVLAFSPPSFDNFLGPLKRELEETPFNNTDYRLNVLIYGIKQIFTRNIINILQTTKYNESQIEEVAKFVIELDTLTKTTEKMSQSFTMTTIENLNDMLGDNFDIYALLNADVSDTNQWNVTSTVMVNNIQYFQYVGAFLRSKRASIIADYLTLITTTNLARYSSQAQLGDNNWRKCIDDLIGLEATVKVYADNFGASRSVQNDYLYILNDLRDFYSSSHSYLPQEQTQKIRNIEIKVGVPKHLQNQSTIETIYSTVHLNSSNYFATIVRTLKAQRDYRLRNIGGQLDGNDNVHWKPLLPEITYDEHENVMFIPISLLQLPPLNMEPNSHPKWMTYSSLGFLFYQKLSQIVWNNDRSIAYKNRFLNCFDKTHFAGAATYEVANQVLYNTDALDTLLNKIQDDGQHPDSKVSVSNTIPNFLDYNIYQLAVIQASSFMCYKDDPTNTVQIRIHERSLTYSLMEISGFAAAFNCTSQTYYFNRCIERLRISK